MLPVASAGASVLLLDRAHFPRDKPCGGAVTARALRELPVGIEQVVETVVSRLELRVLADAASLVSPPSHSCT